MAQFSRGGPAQLHLRAELQLEDGFDQLTIVGLERRGHRLRSMGRWASQAATQLIAVAPDGLLLGASDPRAEGLALGL